MTDNEEPLYPIRLYLYDANGRYGEPIQIDSQEQLYGVGTRTLIKMHMQNEVRMTDPMDRLVFHAKDNEVLFPTERDREIEHKRSRSR